MAPSATPTATANGSGTKTQSKVDRFGWNEAAVDQWLKAKIVPRLPERIFDAHMHIYRAADFGEAVPEYMTYDPFADLSHWRGHLGRMVGGEERLSGALVLPFPTVHHDTHDINKWVTERTADAAGTSTPVSTAILVDPLQSPESYEYMYDVPQVGGFKVYHIYERSADTGQAKAADFTPEWIWEQAHDRGFFIMLHMVRPRSLTDPGNQTYIREHCERYPNAKLILAHAARGFHGPDTTEGIESLKGLQNVWFDTSAICEAEAFIAIIREFGFRRLMYGSDFPVSALRGRAVTMGDGFAWVQADTTEWESSGYFGEPAQVGIEGLRALLLALDITHANAEDRLDVFSRNAERLLGFREEDPMLGQKLYTKAKEIVAGGVQLYSKDPDRAVPGLWPPYQSEARGAEIWDVSGRRWLDVGHHGIGACALGYRDPDVTEAVMRRVSLGSYSILNSPEEPEVAEMLCELHPFAEKVRFARSGGETLSVAARIARSTTKRSVIAICGYHGWHDWYLASNLGETDALDGHLMAGLMPNGVPRELHGTALTFHQNDKQAVSDIMKQHGDNLAAVIMEPFRSHAPQDNFLQFVRDECHKVGALLVFDEVSAGWRLEKGGAHKHFDVEPDIACFAKALGSGHPMGAIIGTSAAMDGYYRSFISSTYWTEGVGFAAAKATLQKMMHRVDVPAHCLEFGTKFRDMWQRVAAKHGVAIELEGDVPNFPHFQFIHEDAGGLTTLYRTLLMDHGVLGGNSVFVCTAHTDEVVAEYEAAADQVMAQLAEAIDAGDIASRLVAGEASQGFQRLN